MRLDCGCPSEYPEWHDSDIDLGGTLVHQQKTRLFLHMPIGFEAYLHKQDDDVKKLQLTPLWPGFVLSQSGMFSGRLLYPLKEQDSAVHKTHRLKNPYWLRAHILDGDISDIKNIIRSMQTTLIQEARMPKELYLSYLTCPLCQAERGGNKIMILRHWQSSEKLKQRLAKQAAAKKTMAKA